MFSTREGMISASRGQLSYKQGLLLISISHGLNCPSIMKSMPNSSKLCYFRSGSMLEELAFKASVAIAFS